MPLEQFAKLSSSNPGFSTEPNADGSSYLDNHVIVTQKDNSYNITKKSLKNALAQEKRAKSTIQSLREKSDVLCDQLSEACKARESMEKALGYLKSIVDTSSAEIAKLQEQINTLVQLTTQQSQELVALSTELAVQIKNCEALKRQKLALYHSQDAMHKRLGCTISRITSYKDQSNDKTALADPYLLKDSAGVIKPETRDMIQKLACEGVSTERASEVINIVAEGLGIDVIGTMQLAHELEHAKSVTICGDGTSIKHQQYEAKSAYIQLPTQDGSLSSPSTSATPVYQTFGVQRAPTHVAKQQLDSWIGAIDTCCSLLACSPLGKGSCMSSKMVAPKLCGMLTDHASDQKCLHGLLVEWKHQCDWEARATLKLAEMSVEEQLNMLTHHLDSSVSGVKDWRSLSPQHQDTVMHDAWFALAAQIGDEEFQKLSPDAQFDVNFLAWAGCCMHKELNVVKGGVANMASAWKELNLVPLLPLPNKYEAEKHQDLSLDNVGQGVIKILDLLGALCHNKDEKKGYHSMVDAFFQNPDLLLALEAALTNATLDGQIWDQPKVIYAVLYQIPHLPNIQPILVAFFEGALKTWEQFMSEFNSNGIIAQAMPEQHESAWIAPTNDTSEGALGQCCQMLHHAPTMSDEQRNARVMWLRHNTYEWKKQMLTKDDEKFIQQEARMLDLSGVNKKVQAELHNAFQE
ncbi:hypothetical protein OPQ81_010771 [Rhizoctonia solani]|nr:hypothetical protein OPQ81_010771 [Rhizoctonia solani]